MLSADGLADGAAYRGGAASSDSESIVAESSRQSRTTQSQTLPATQSHATQPQTTPNDAAIAADDKPMSPARAALEALRLAGLRVPSDKSRASAHAAPRRPTPASTAPVVVPTPRRPAEASTNGASEMANTANTNGRNAGPASAPVAPEHADRTSNTAKPAPTANAAQLDTPPWDALPDAAYESGGYDAGGAYDGAFDEGYADFAAMPVNEPSLPPKESRGASRNNGSNAQGPSGASTRASTAAPVTEVIPKEPPVRLDAFGHDSDWPAFVTRLALRGFARELAFRSELIGVQGTTLELRVAVPQLGDRAHVDKLKAELETHLGRKVELQIVNGAVHYTAAAIEDANRARRQFDAEQAIEHDPFVQSLIRDFGASIVPGSIRPVQHNAGAAGAG